MFKFTFLNIFLSVFLIPLMMQCDNRGENPCDQYTNVLNEQDLILISPTKQSYTQGETIKLKFSVPSKMKVSSKDIDIFQTTKQSSGILRIYLSELFQDNTVNFVKGKKIDDFSSSPVYNSITDSYELEVDIILNKKGIYSFDSLATFQDREFEDGQCVFIQIITSIKGNNISDNRFEFVVT
ncbi:MULTISPECIES: hypothetical protein [Chryseobacterium]|uniref:hypothetical protein n=1 Tax=Chryseobacterium TaxID=59732 RepID=UPI000F4D9708|nr:MULTISPECIES: hypothetical protein [Chryseobacterium]